MVRPRWSGAGRSLRGRSRPAPRLPPVGVVVVATSDPRFYWSESGSAYHLASLSVPSSVTLRTI